MVNVADRTCNASLPAWGPTEVTDDTRNLELFVSEGPQTEIETAHAISSLLVEVEAPPVVEPAVPPALGLPDAQRLPRRSLRHHSGLRVRIPRSWLRQAIAWVRSLDEKSQLTLRARAALTMLGATSRLLVRALRTLGTLSLLEMRTLRTLGAVWLLKMRAQTTSPTSSSREMRALATLDVLSRWKARAWQAVATFEVSPVLKARAPQAVAGAAITVAMIAAAGQLKVAGPKPLAPVTAIAQELPHLAPFPATTRLATPIAAVRSEVQVPIASRGADSRAVQAALNGYRDALSTLDANAVGALWPSANVAALRRQFDAVQDQNVEFDGCRIAVADTVANAACTGVIESGIVPGARRPKSSRAQWEFTLDRSGDRWLIRTVATRYNGRGSTN